MNASSWKEKTNNKITNNNRYHSERDKFESTKHDSTWKIQTNSTVCV